MKLEHTQAAEILRLLCEKVNFLGSNMRGERIEVMIGLIRAAEEGNVEFVVKVLKEDPQLVQLVTGKLSNIFFIAVKNRQAQVFNLIHGLRSKDKIASQIDKNGNTMLHVVANPPPPFKVNRISGPPFQMQYELQWLKETANSCSVVGALVVTIMFAAAFSVPGGNY